MNYQLIYENEDEDLMTRLLKVRNVDDNIDSFLNPKISDYRLDPFLLNDMEKAVDRIIKAVKNNEKIMVFGDYDVDGVTSSFILYKFIVKYLGHKNVSIQYPDRIKQGYGIKKEHIDEIKDKGVSLIITVDNGIASLEEALYAKEVGIDLIITDHHQDLESVPEAFAVVNPQISPDYPFKGIAGVGVAFKLICALLSKSNFDTKKRNRIFNYFLPIVTIGTVADVVPLIGENRAMVKKGLEMLSTRHEHIPSSIKGFLDYLKLGNNIDTFHIGFLIGPRINAGGRIKSPYDSLNALLYSGAQQISYLDALEQINTDRKQMQDKIFKLAESNVNLDRKLIFCADEDFHEGVVGIVAGRLTEKYSKPSVILKIDTERGLATASLRGPDYFSVIDMLKYTGDLLERFGGHKCAGGLAVKIENIAKLKEAMDKYCDENIKDEEIGKSVNIDTKIYEHEWEFDNLKNIERLAPFGQGNEEPVFLIENMKINKVEKVGNKAKSHLKLHTQVGDKNISVMFWGKGDEVKDLEEKVDGTLNIIGKIKRDNFNGGFFVDGIKWE